MKQLLMLWLFFMFAVSSLTHAQTPPQRFGERLVVGSSLTYIPKFNDHNRQWVHHELTWNKNIAVNLSPRWYLGLAYHHIYTRGSAVRLDRQRRANYFMAGAFAQYDLFRWRKNRFFGEFSWNFTDYCTCGEEDPYYKAGLQRWGWGMGAELPLNAFLSLDLAFNAYLLTTPEPERYGFTQYIVGLNLDFMNIKRK